MLLHQNLRNAFPDKFGKYTSELHSEIYIESLDPRGQVSSCKAEISAAVESSAWPGWTNVKKCINWLPNLILGAPQINQDSLDPTVFFLKYAT